MDFIPLVPWPHLQGSREIILLKKFIFYAAFNLSIYLFIFSFRKIKGLFSFLIAFLFVVVVFYFSIFIF